MIKHIIERTVTLTPHPTISNRVVNSIDVQVMRSHTEQACMLTFTYTLTGDCNRLRIPPPRSPTKVDDLWRHTCFEAFVAEQSKPAYWEFNFSPSGEWACYSFSSYRKAAPTDAEEPVPTLTASRMKKQLQVTASMYLPQSFSAQPLRLALSAVIEEQSGVLSYWALQHPSDKPDFHHVESFVLTIAPPA